MFSNIRKSFSTTLSLGILAMAVTIFMVSLGVLFTQSRHIIRREAVGRATSVLNNTMQQIIRNLKTIENATNAYSWMIEQSFEPESMFEFSNRIVRLNPHIDGCSISAEPNTFKKYGRHFSVYTVREPDTITTVIEEEYEYFQRIWYKAPHDLNAGCWEVYYDDVDSLELTIEGMIASYGKPLHDDDGNILGIISTDLSLLRLSKVMSEEKPYPNSYFMMIDKEGRFFVHPDSTRLFTQTIFTDVDPRKQSDIIALGHEMVAGKEGRMVVNFNGSTSIVCYQPVPGTNWSLALVCPDSDILAGYYRLIYIVVALLIIGLTGITLLCHRSIAYAIRPLNQLFEKTQSIADGNLEVHIAKSQREDVTGHLQNSFATMLQSLNFHIGSVIYSTEQASLRNEELEKATILVQEAERQKTLFIQNVSHQIRTPLNIIMGFAQVLSNTSDEGLTDEEMKNILGMMHHNSIHLHRMLMMLFDSSDTGLTEELNSEKHEAIPCNDIARDAIEYTKRYYPNLHINFKTEIDNDFSIQGNRTYLKRALRELVYNSAKYSDQENIKLQVYKTDSAVKFMIEDTGKGITQAESHDLFKFFTKVDDLTEGLGLGLPLAMRHVHTFGGELTLDTEYQEGCRFIIEIPY